MLKISHDHEEIEINNRLSVLPLKEVVVYPYMVFPLLVGREPSLRAIQEAMMLNKLIFLTAQKDLSQEEPTKDELYRFGVVARILQVLKLPNGLMKVLVEGLVRGKILRFMPITDHFEVKIELFEDVESDDLESQALMRKAMSLFKDYVSLNPNIPDEVLLTLESIHSAPRLAYYLAAHIRREVSVKQQILEFIDPMDQLMFIIHLLQSENQILEIEQQIDEKVRDRIQRSQRNFYLQEQMRVIQEELGEESQVNGEIGRLKERIL
ncbi:MAG: endopeptidase La, partial [Calditrichaeota bacterium]